MMDPKASARGRELEGLQAGQIWRSRSTRLADDRHLRSPWNCRQALPLSGASRSVPRMGPSLPADGGRLQGAPQSHGTDREPTGEG